MPSKISLVNVFRFTTKIYIHFLLFCHFTVADIFRNDQKLAVCPSGKISSFEDNAICVIPLDGTCEDYQETKPNSFKCGPGSECFNTTCRCVTGHAAYDDKSGCKLSISPPQPPKLPIPLISKGVVSLTGVLPALTISNSTKIEDQSGKKTTRKESYVVSPTTIEATLNLKSTVPTTSVYNDTNVVFANFPSALISRTGSYGSQGGYHKGSYYGNSTHRNNTAVFTQKADFNNAVICSILSSVAFHLFHF